MGKKTQTLPFLMKEQLMVTPKIGFGGIIPKLVAMRLQEVMLELTTSLFLVALHYVMI